jgi:tRNA-specific 2-thiouridylase
MKVYVGLSGGVDSAVSAALLQQQGHEVTGIFIRIALEGYPCSAGEDKIEAQRVAAHLGIGFKSIDLSKQYADEVFKNTIDEYKAGRTPNPDALCNQKIKFGAFFDWCMQDGAETVATGHYAQVKDGRLYKGMDTSKDQSYFLWMVPKQALAKTLFPIGHLEKSKVRALAEKFNLPNAKRRDSQGLCFLGGITIDDMLERELTLKPGDVIDEEGAVIGSHKGVQLYTLGQRHGFILSNHSNSTVPQYIVGKDAAKNLLVASTNRYPTGAAATNIDLVNCNWISNVEPGAKVEARYRYRQQLMPATAESESKILLHEPQYVPLGQSLVLYKGEECLGGGVIASATLLNVDK